MIRKMGRSLLAAAQLGGCRVRFRAGDLISPDRCARDAVRLWLTPPRGRTHESPTLPGHTETTIATSTSGSVRTLSWGTGPPIYFMHGWGGVGLHVQPFVESLVRRGFRVVTFDATGHGNNRREPTHAGELGANLATVAQHHGQPHGIIAHSLGAVAVTRAALDHQLHLGRLVLLAPLVDATTALNRFAELLHIGSRVRRRLPLEVLDQTGLGLDQFSCHDLPALVEGRSTLIMHDPADASTSFVDSAALARSWKYATFTPVNGRGHYRLLRDPDVIAATVQTLETVRRVVVGGQVFSTQS